MATGDSLSGDQVTLWVEDADVIGSALANEYQAEVTNFNVEGGATEYESIVVFGGGNIDKKKPTEQLEISMDVILRYGTDVDQWDVLAASTAAKMIALQATDGTNYYYRAYNNVKVVNFDTEFSAEDEWRGTMRFKLSPTDADGVDNVQTGKANIATDLTAWS